MAAIKTLERKIERHEKDSQDTINSIKSELRTLQSFRRPVRTDVKTAEVPKGIQPESARKATTKPMTKMKGDDKKLVSSCSDLRMSKRTVKFFVDNVSKFNYFFRSECAESSQRRGAEKCESLHKQR